MKTLTKPLLLMACLFMLSTMQAYAVDGRPVKSLTKAEAQAIPLTWTDANGVQHATNLAEPATDPRHMIALLREVYMNKNVPGNYNRAYTSTFAVEKTIIYSIASNYSGSKQYAGWNIPKGDYKPKDEGLTLLLVEITDSYKAEDVVKNHDISTYANLVSFFKNYVKSVRLITDGKHIENGAKSSTIFNLSGRLSRFFFLAKGKCSSNFENHNAPFGDGALFEQFSPVDNVGGGGEDLYARLVANESFEVEHDCPTVLAKGHEFQMKKGSTDYYDVSNLMFSIPDYRLAKHNGRDVDGNKYYYYHPQYSPTVMLYTVKLTAKAEPAGAENKYTVTLNWTSSLNEVTGVTNSQIYKVYRVVNGAVTGEPIFTGTDVYTWSEEVDQTKNGYYLTYLVTAEPADGSFPQAQSNNARVAIPGLDPLERMELVISGDNRSVFDPVTITNTYTNTIVLNNGVGYTVKGSHLEEGTMINFERQDSLGNVLETLETIEFTNIGSHVFDYKVIKNGEEIATGRFTSDVNDDVDFNQFQIVDIFSVSTALNNHPGMYKYQASFTPPAGTDIPGAEGAKVYSNQLEIKVFKTFGRALGTFTQAQVDADILRPSEALSNVAGLTTTLENSSDVFSYDLWNSHDNSNWVKTQSHAQRQNSGAYMIHDGAGNQSEVPFASTQPYMAQPIPDANATAVGAYNYVPVITTFPVNGATDHYNTYGANRDMSLVTKVNLAEASVMASDNQFVDNGVTCRHYEVTLPVSVAAPEGVTPQFVRVWKRLPDGMAHEETLYNGTRPYEYRLDQTQRCYIYPERYENNGGDEAAQDFSVEEFSPNTTVNVYDYFGATDVVDAATGFDVDYIIRFYSIIGEPATAQVAGNILKDNSGVMWAVSEVRETVSVATNIPTGINGVSTIAGVKEVAYYNLMGVKSSTPWPGVNVVVTLMDNGTTITRKMIK